MFSTLARIFVTERHRRRAGDIGFSVPVMSEIELDVESGPLLVSNLRGTFLKSRPSSSGFARFAFMECPLEAEVDLFREFYRVLQGLSNSNAWPNRATSILEGVNKLRELGSQPKFVIASESVEIEGLTSLTADLPVGSALITAHPQLTGMYTRIGDHLGILAQRVDRAFVVVQ